MIARWLLIVDNMYRTWPASTWWIAFCGLWMNLSIASGGRL